MPVQDTSNCQLIAKEFDRLIENTANVMATPSSTHKTEDPECRLFAWGSNSRGQIGTGREFANDPIPINFAAIKRLVSVACGDSHTLMLSDTSVVFALGDNSRCQLGISPTVKVAISPQKVEGLANPSLIECGAFTSYAICSGHLFSWGEAVHSALGTPPMENTWRPLKVGLSQVKSVSAGDKHAAAITRDGQMYVWGDNSHG